MLNTNNTVNYEINVKRKEKKYSWSTVFAWLYLKTIGRILPKKWNKWAENILSNKVTFQDTIMQTECVETTDRNIGADLKPEVAEKGSQSEIMSEDEEIYSEVSSGSTDESFDAKLNDEFIDEDYNGMEEVCTEDDKELNAQLEGVNQELELEHSQNAFLKKENEDLESKLAECEKDYTELEDVSGQLEEELQAESEEKSQLIFELIERLIKCSIESLNEIRRLPVEVEKDMKINSFMRLNEGLDEDLQGKNQKLAEQEKLIEQLKKEQKQVEDQLKADIKKLQGEKENMEEQLKIMQQQLLNNQEQQKLEEKLKDVDKRLEDIDGETQKSQGQTKTKASDTVSLVSAASTKKSLNYSMKSTQSNVSKVFSKLFRDKNLDDFLSDKNKELKENFPEFTEKHFCHNVHNKTIKFLSNQNDGKFESSKLLELLESNLKQSAKEIIEAKVKEVVNEHCNIGKNVGKELRDGTLKAKLSPSVRKCVKKLDFNKQEEGVNKIVDSILHSFNSKNNNNNDSGELLKEIVVKELVETRMRFFSDKIQELQLTSSIRDKFLSPDQKMCNQTQGGVNEYQLTEKAKKEYTPNFSMSHTNIASIHSLNSRKAVRVGS